MKGRPVAAGILLSAMLASARLGAAASSIGTPGAVTLSLGATQGWSDALLAGESRPSPHSMTGGSLQLLVGIGGDWALSLEGHGAGSWLDYSNGLDAMGNTTWWGPGFRVGIDRVIAVGPATATIGAAFDYSETRSWIHNTVYRVPYDVTGPTNFMRGACLQASLTGPALGRVAPYLGFSQLVSLTHSADAAIHNEFNWLGGATSIGVGVRVLVHHPHSEPR